MATRSGDQRGAEFCYQDYFINRSTARGGNATWTGGSGNEGETERRLRFWSVRNIIERGSDSRRETCIKGEGERERERGKERIER